MTPLCLAAAALWLVFGLCVFAVCAYGAPMVDEDV